MSSARLLPRVLRWATSRGSIIGRARAVGAAIAAITAWACARGVDGDVLSDGGTEDAASGPGAGTPGGSAGGGAPGAGTTDAGRDASTGDASADAALDARLGDAADAATLPASIANGLLLHLTLDDGLASDARGLHPASAFTTTNLASAPDRFGRPAGAARFAGSPPSLVQITPNSMPLGNAARTLAIWAKPRVPAPAPTAQRPNSNVFVHWGIDDCQSKMFGLGHPTDVAFGWTGCVDVTTTQPVTPGRWTFLAATFDGASTLTVWDGEQKTSRTGVTLATTAAPLAVGGERRTFGLGFYYYFDGDLDDVRVWDRALTDLELTALARDR